MACRLLSRQPEAQPGVAAGGTLAVAEGRIEILRTVGVGAAAYYAKIVFRAFGFGVGVGLQDGLAPFGDVALHVVEA